MSSVANVYIIYIYMDIYIYIFLPILGVGGCGGRQKLWPVQVRSPPPACAWVPRKHYQTVCVPCVFNRVCCDAFTVLLQWFVLPRPRSRDTACMFSQVWAGSTVRLKTSQKMVRDDFWARVCFLRGRVVFFWAGFCFLGRGVYFMKLESNSANWAQIMKFESNDAKIT
jgi:hypothetical protein